jgi:FixJ family two-component response regulator
MRSAGSRNVETFACAEDFLKGAAFKKPSLLIEELPLPDISGIDLYRRLKPDSWSYMTIDHI